MTVRQLQDEMKKLLPAGRYEHTVGVTYTACCLAYRYGADPEKARIAGLLHDCAKYIPSEEKIVMAEQYGIPLSDCRRKNPELLHAPLGAVLAREQYGVTDDEILSAITWHTTGKPQMSLLDKIVFIADYMEPNRNHAPDLAEIRVLAFEDLDACLLRILAGTITYLKSMDAAIDPMTEKTYHYYREET